MNKEETIAMLNSLVKIKVAPSKINGVGLFAMRDIPKGTKLYAAIAPQGFRIPFEDFDKVMPDVKDYILGRWPRIAVGDSFVWPDTILQTYINHKDKPNYDCLKDITLKDIKKGQEITEDYRVIEGWEKAHTWL